MGTCMPCEVGNNLDLFPSGRIKQLGFISNLGLLVKKHGRSYSFKAKGEEKIKEFKRDKDESQNPRLKKSHSYVCRRRT